MKSKVPVVKAIKTPAAYIHPDAPYEMLPKHEFSMALIVSTFLFSIFIIPFTILLMRAPSKI